MLVIALIGIRSDPDIFDNTHSLLVIKNAKSAYLVLVLWIRTLVVSFCTDPNPVADPDS